MTGRTVDLNLQDMLYNLVFLMFSRLNVILIQIVFMYYVQSCIVWLGNTGQDVSHTDGLQGAHVSEIVYR